MLLNNTNTKQKTFAQHILTRAVLIVLAFSLLFFGIAVPILKNQVSQLVSSQSDALANATIAATENAIYKHDYGTVIEFIMGVLTKSPDAKYISISEFNGRSISITSDQWKFNNEIPSAQSPKGLGLARDKSHPFTGQSTFEFTKIINISGLDWGVISIGISPSLYLGITDDFIQHMILIYALFIISLSFVLYTTSRKIQKQIKSLQAATSSLASGDFTSKVESSDIMEFNSLGLSYNRMSDSLRENIDEINKLAKVVENTSDAILVLNKDQHVIFANKSLINLSSEKNNNLRGKKLLDIAQYIGINEYYLEKLENHLSPQKSLPFSFDAKLETNEYTDIYVSIRADHYIDKNTNTLYYFILITDITKRKTLEDKLNDLAYYDKLTKLPNRQLFLLKLKEKLKSKTTPFSLLFIDLDNFKMVNDTMGHEAGDQLLQIVTQRLKGVTTKDDMLCRLGGDEFTVIINGKNNKAQTSSICNKIINTIQTPIHLFNRVVHVGSSIGAVTYPEDGNDLLKKADIAMYEAKRNGKNQYNFFTPELNKKITHYVKIESELREIINKKQLVLYYQPIYRSNPYSLAGFEALIRWNHPTRGIVLPGDFISIAEQSRLILDIGEWVIEEACNTLHYWKELGLDIRIAVNVSGHQLQENNFVENSLEIIDKNNIAHKNLVMEFTESVLIERKQSSFEKLIKLKNHGIQLALDDFGTGFSSLSYLNYFPIDILKIDRSFISRIPNDYKAESIVGAIISLTSELGISCVGEGIENIEQANWLTHKKCSYLQGFYYNKPLPKEEATSLLFDAHANENSRVLNFTGEHKIIRNTSYNS